MRKTWERTKDAVSHPMDYVRGAVYEHDRRKGIPHPEVAQPQPTVAYPPGATVIAPQPNVKPETG